jgi:hypothetical protein
MLSSSFCTTKSTLSPRTSLGELAIARVVELPVLADLAVHEHPVDLRGREGPSGALARAAFARFSPWRMSCLLYREA